MNMNGTSWPIAFFIMNEKSEKGKFINNKKVKESIIF
jgi:hypothetical protein